MDMFSEAERIFKATRDALSEFKDIITPVIEHAKDEHERLYWHHIYEEEDHRLDRLDQLLPALEAFQNKKDTPSGNNSEFVRLLQDISLEKFGLHNFLEHLDLSLYTFEGTEFEEKIKSLRNMTAEDYETSKQLLEQMNEEFNVGLDYKAATPTDEKEELDESLKVEAYTGEPAEQVETQVETESEKTEKHKKKLTVGSLKNR
ncbi:IMEF encapsulin system ferritin-like cargo protein [Alteribacillus iranensis]|uniref:Encapsulated protein n=1 Tax=Alteribacillus iranensis TaxID=930128 RepID=A0A1I2B4F4_9BACI|nr:IMEF encapsulin system ferritin-like cargo protein [Alteribacillus iranensis]SFE50939.1 encapsulated protein [Alteribacillus iranensis]